MSEIKISNLPSGVANAFSVVPADNASGTLTEKITLGSIVQLQHNHNISDINNFNPSVSGLIPVKSISGSGNISITSSSGNYTIINNSGVYSLNTENIVSFAPILNIVSCSQEDYDALENPDINTLYFINN